MTPGDRLNLKVGRTTLQVPVIDDEDTTRAVVDELNRRLARIERDSDRVDSQAFALLAALEYAAELHHLHAAGKRETAELLKHLEALSSRLRRILLENRAPG